MMEDRPGAIGFTSGFSQDSISITVGEQIAVEQLIEKGIIMRLSRHDHVYRQVLVAGAGGGDWDALPTVPSTLRCCRL